MVGMVSSPKETVVFHSEVGKASPALLIHAQVTVARMTLSLVLVAASLASVEAASTTTCLSEGPSWVMTFVDGMVALVFGLLWACRIYVLRTSYSSYRAASWASLRCLAYWLSVIAIVVALGAIIFGLVMQPSQPTSMPSVVAVVVGAFITIAVEQRSQGLPSAKLWNLQKLLQMPFYRVGEVGPPGMASAADKRNVLFEENDCPSVKSSEIRTWSRSTWHNTALLSKYTRKGVVCETWTYYVKPGPINDHCYLGKYEVLEMAASGDDPILFAAAHASVTTAYMTRIGMGELQKNILKIMFPAEPTSSSTGAKGRSEAHHPVPAGYGRLRNSLRSWRRNALQRHLVEGEEVEWGSISSQRPNAPPDIGPLNEHALTVCWAVCWLEVPEVMESIMDLIATHLKIVHADGRTWSKETEEGTLMNGIRTILRGLGNLA
ncbi:hypothetical protein M758_3G248500 [Ceratodon purpureus]|nr:hypothetical protein M758_3G248500 [Ceratodon purpureus]